MFNVFSHRKRDTYSIAFCYHMFKTLPTSIFAASGRPACLVHVFQACAMAWLSICLHQLPLAHVEYHFIGISLQFVPCCKLIFQMFLRHFRNNKRIEVKGRSLGFSFLGGFNTIDSEIYTSS